MSDVNHVMPGACGYCGAASCHCECEGRREPEPVPETYDCDACGKPTPIEDIANVPNPHGDGGFCPICRSGHDIGYWSRIASESGVLVTLVRAGCLCGWRGSWYAQRSTAVASGERHQRAMVRDR